MPFYEYKCADCDKPFELLVSSPALADSVVCRYCGSESVRRLISSFASRANGPSTLESMTAGAAPRAGGGGCCGGSCGCGH